MGAKSALKLKVCGLCRAEDVTAAVGLGADLLGFVLAASPRQISRENLEELVALVPSTIITVAVVVDPCLEFADSLLNCVDRIQFHGNESPDFCSRFGRRAIKAFRIQHEDDLRDLKPYESSVGAFLLDSFKKGQAGGTGHSFPWSYLDKKSFSLPTFLAGGLTASNVRDALRVSSVSGLDLSSGLESEPGIKDRKKMMDFFNTVRQTKQEQ